MATVWESFYEIIEASTESLLDLTERFSFGMNLDDAWRYAGITPPRSIIIPHLLSVSLPEGRVLDLADDQIIREHGDAEPNTAAKRASLSLAENLVQARIDFVRCWFPWNFFEPTPTATEQLDQLLEKSYSNWPMDSFVSIMNDHGIGIIPVLACGYQRMLPQGLNLDSDKALYLKRASTHARLLVRKYKDKVKSWQIENEPNWWAEHAAGGWRSGFAWVHQHDFRQELLKTLRDAVHEEDESALTIINLEADAKTLDVAIYAPYCDMIGLDFYPNYKSPSPIDTTVFKLADTAAGTVGKPVLISETGYPSGPSLLGYSTEKQAEYVTSSCRSAHMLKGVNGIGIWRYTDTSWRSFPPQENHFGLFDNKGNPKQAWGTLSNTIRELK